MNDVFKSAAFIKFCVFLYARLAAMHPETSRVWRMDRIAKIAPMFFTEISPGTKHYILIAKVQAALLPTFLSESNRVVSRLSGIFTGVSILPTDTFLCKTKHGFIFTVSGISALSGDEIVLGPGDSVEMHRVTKTAPPSCPYLFPDLSVQF